MKLSTISIAYDKAGKEFTGTAFLTGDNGEDYFSGAPSISIKLNENDLKQALEFLVPSICNKAHELCNGVSVESLLGITPPEHDLPF